jgi:hypothetical protein
MEIDDIFGYAKLSIMQISFSVVAIMSLTALGHLSFGAARAAEKPMMKAIVAHEYGGPEVLKFEEVPRPELKENEALVRVIASSVNPADPLTLSGKYAREFGTHLPLIPGYDIAGIVEKTGVKVTKLKVRDAIMVTQLLAAAGRSMSPSPKERSLRSPRR